MIQYDIAVVSMAIRNHYVCSNLRLPSKQSAPKMVRKTLQDFTEPRIDGTMRRIAPRIHIDNDAWVDEVVRTVCAMFDNVRRNEQLS